MVLYHLCRKNMIKKFQKAEEDKFIKYCEKNNITTEVLTSINEIIEQFLSFDSNNKFINNEELGIILNKIDNVSEWLGIELCYSIYTRDIIEEYSKQELLNQLNTFEELPIYDMKCITSDEALGNNLNQYFIEYPYTPQYKVLTYEDLYILVDSLIEDIKELSENKGQF